MKRGTAIQVLPDGLTYPPLAGGGLIEASSWMDGVEIPGEYPPLAGGGLIEATRAQSSLRDSRKYPPLAGGGLIEASLTSWTMRRPSGRNRRSRAAPSLKQRHRDGGKFRYQRIRRSRAAASLKHQVW